MENVNFIKFEGLEGSVEHALISHADGTFTSMPKSVYDAQQAQATLVTESAPTA